MAFTQWPSGNPKTAFSACAPGSTKDGQKEVGMNSRNPDSELLRSTHPESWGWLGGAVGQFSHPKTGLRVDHCRSLLTITVQSNAYYAT